MMKKRLLALIMAGLLTATLASCVATGGGDDTGGTEGSQPIHTSGTNQNGGNGDSPVEVWKNVDKIVYTVSETALRSEAKDSGSLLATLPALTELRCTKQNGFWSYVEFNGTAGYVSNKALTDVDLLAKNFVAVEGGRKTMYVSADELNMRLYPATSADLSISLSMGTLVFGDEVCVVSENKSWSRIEYVKDGATNYYYVASDYLSSTKPIDYTKDDSWKAAFVNCETPLIRYTDGNVNLRSVPFVSDKTLVQTLEGGDIRVTVYAIGTVGDSEWSRVSVEIPPQKEGDSATYKEGYINSKHLTKLPSTAPVTLESVLSLYAGIEKLATPRDMYATQNVWFRSNPENFSAEYKVNKVDILDKKEKVTVLATGVYEGLSCCVFQYEVSGEVGYYFILAEYLTPDPEGNPMISLDTLAIQYPKFTVLVETYQKTVTMSKANCYYTPANANTAALVLSNGDSVTVVAEETGSLQNTWLVVRASDGNLYFLSKQAVQ